MEKTQKPKIRKFDPKKDNIEKENEITMLEAKNDYNNDNSSYCKNCKQNVVPEEGEVFVICKKVEQRWELFWPQIFWLLFFCTLVIGAIIYTILYFTVGKQKVVKEYDKLIEVCPICKTAI